MCRLDNALSRITRHVVYLCLQKTLHNAQQMASQTVDSFIHKKWSHFYNIKSVKKLSAIFYCPLKIKIEQLSTLLGDSCVTPASPYAMRSCAILG